MKMEYITTLCQYNFKKKEKKKLGFFFPFIFLNTACLYCTFLYENVVI